jgi:hypothetical protein
LGEIRWHDGHVHATAAGAPPARDNGLGTATVIIVAIWAAADVLFGAAEVFAGPVSPDRFGLQILGLMAFVTSLNVVVAALVTGPLAIFRSRDLPWAWSIVFVALMGAGIVGSFALSGWGLGSGDSAPISDQALRLRGLGIWVIAAVVMLVSCWLFRSGPDVRRARRESS